MTKKQKPLKSEDVFTLLVEVKRSKKDGLPVGCSGADILCYTAARTEGEAVRETVRLLKQADMNPLDVTGYGTIDERESDGQSLSDKEKGLMAQAKEENSVIIAQITPYFENSLKNHENSFLGS